MVTDFREEVQRGLQHVVDHPSVWRCSDGHSFCAGCRPAPPPGCEVEGLDGFRCALPLEFGPAVVLVKTLPGLSGP